MLGELIRSARQEQLLSLRALGRQTGRSAAQLGEIERGNHVPSPRTIMLIAKNLTLGDTWVPLWLAVEPRVSTQIRCMELLLEEGYLTAARLVLTYALLRNRVGYNYRYRQQLYHLAGKLAYLQGRYTTARLWFSKMGSRLPHATPLTRGTAFYDHGMTLMKTGRFSEGFEAFWRARRAFSSQSGLALLEGYATWAMANCLFDQFQYGSARKLYADALAQLRHSEYSSHVEFGLVLTNWIVSPSVITARSLKDFGSDSLNESIEGRWRLAMGIYHRQSGRCMEALHTLGAIKSDERAQDIFVESLAERALCHWEMGDAQAASDCLSELQTLRRYASSNVLLFGWILRSILGTAPVPTGNSIVFHEGYDKRLQRLASCYSGPPRNCPS